MENLLNQAMDILRSGGGLLIATADHSGIPHMTSAGQANLEPEGRIAILEWFCPRTLENLKENKNVSVLIYNPTTREGHQLVGTVEDVSDVAVMDGFLPESEQGIPQVERELVIRVTTVLDYSHGPHTDSPRNER